MIDNKETMFVKDGVIDLEKNDPLGTKSYSDAIYNIIKNKKDDDPLTLGLFGGWGSGKSSIVETVRNKLTQDSDIGVMSYDAWKYSKDAFRRSFILELKREFELDMGMNLESFYKDKTEEIEHKIALKKSKTAWIINLLVVLIPCVISIGYIVYKANLNEISVGDGVYISALWACITLLTYMVKESLVEYKISVNKHKIFSPEQFEEIFKEAVDSLTSRKLDIIQWFKGIMGKEKKYRKIVIIIDNMDRCDSDLAKELLLTVKNFLEVEKCIFIIPVDDESLKKHLNYQNREGEEFLRKFFNITLRIKAFTTKNLREFTKHLIEDKKLGFSYRVADIIAQEFSKNPRRIKQFLNNLHAEYMIAYAQEEGGLIPKGTITTNIDFLAKVLIIKEEWPQLYKLFNEYPNVMKKVNEHIRDSEFDYDENSNYYAIKEIEGLKSIELSKEQYLFLRRNLTIMSRRIEPFFRLRDFEKDIPENIMEAIIQGDWNVIKECMDKGQIKLDRMVEILFNEYDSSVTKRPILFKTTGFNLINLLLEIINYDVKRGDIVVENSRFKQVMDDRKVKSIIMDLNIHILLNCATKLVARGDEYLRDDIVSVLKSTKDKKRILMYIKYFIDDGISLSKIQPIVEDATLNGDIRAEELNEYIKTEEHANAIITQDMIEYMIGKIDNKIDDKNEKLVDFVRRMNSLKIVMKENKERYLNKLFPFINTNLESDQLYWFESIQDFFYGLENTEIKESINTNINNLYSNLFNSFGSQYTNKDKLQSNKLLLNVLKDFYLYIDSNRKHVLDKIVNYLNRTETEEIYLEANYKLQEVIEHFETRNWDFIGSVMSKLNAVKDSGDKKEMLKTLEIQMEKLKYEDGKYIGMNEAQIKNVIHTVFDMYLGVNQEYYKENMSKLFKIESIKKEVYLEIRTISNVEHKKLLLKLSKDIEIETTQDLVRQILVGSNGEDKLKSSVEFIKEAIEDSDEMLKYGLMELLRSFNGKLEDCDYILKECINNETLFNKQDFDSILDKVERLLQSKEDKVFEVGKDLIIEIQKTKRGTSERVKSIIEEYNVEE